MIGLVKKVLFATELKLRLKKKNTRLYSLNIEKTVNIGKWCTIAKRVILEDNVQIGDYTYLNADKYWITVGSNVKIGKFCSIAPGVHIGAGNHDHTFVTTHPILFDKHYMSALGNDVLQKVHGLVDVDAVTKIGNDVWIGLGAIIKRGVTIGNGVVIAAGSVVVKDVPAYAIVGGNPAKIIKYRTDENSIRFFEENDAHMWWNWDEKEVSSHMDDMYHFDRYKNFLEILVGEKEK